MWPNPQETTDLVTVTEEILDGKPFFVQWLRNEEQKNFLFKPVVYQTELTWASVKKKTPERYCNWCSLVLISINQLYSLAISLILIINKAT